MIEPSDAEMLEAQKRILAAELGAHCRLLADNLAGSISQAAARGADISTSQIRMKVLLDYEGTLQKRVHGRDMPRYEPRWPSRREGAA